MTSMITTLETTPASRGFYTGEIQAGSMDAAHLDSALRSGTVPGSEDPEVDKHLNRLIPKPWGYEYRVYADRLQDLWQLRLRPGQRASMHAHPRKITYQDFDAGCTRMMQALDDCWNGPVETAWPSLGRAVFEMNELRVTSCFRILRHEVPPGSLSRLEELYPLEAADLAELTDLDQPVFYGPRFRNALARR